jgi:hypothetical protein
LRAFLAGRPLPILGDDPLHADQRKVFSVAAADGPRFVYADADYCQCVYAGDKQAYERYQRMVIKQRLAAEQDLAAQMGDDAAMTWSPW